MGSGTWRLSGVGDLRFRISLIEKFGRVSCPGMPRARRSRGSGIRTRDAAALPALRIPFSICERG